MSLDNIWLQVRSNDSFVRVSCVGFMYCAFVSCIICFSYRSCEAFVRFSFAFSIRLHFVHIVSLFDPGFVMMSFLTYITGFFMNFELLSIFDRLCKLEKRDDETTEPISS